MFIVCICGRFYNVVIHLLKAQLLEALKFCQKIKLKLLLDMNSNLFANLGIFKTAFGNVAEKTLKCHKKLLNFHTSLNLIFQKKLKKAF